MSNTILVTGGAGFIGFNFIKICLKNNIKVINIDSLKYAANKIEILELNKNKNYKFYKLNIGQKKKINKLLLRYKIFQIVNFAAESHVDRSIDDPKYFFKNNCLDFVDFISVLKDYHLNLNKKNKSKFKFLHVSTDEVYGSLSKNQRTFKEDSSLKPNNPYSSSKAACELILRSFSKTYNLPYLITNCSNNYGKFQNDEKLIPTIFRNAIRNKNIPIYGTGRNVRDWIYVDDHCYAILKVLIKGKKFQKYNIGANNEISNIDLAKKICLILDKKIPKLKPHKKLITYVKDRAGHDFRYGINSKKIIKLNWKAKIKLDYGLNEVADYFIKRYQ
jgi:dTDP-glucose 4,6-dehydratase